jgi:hypothetical protein
MRAGELRRALAVAVAVAVAYQPRTTAYRIPFTEGGGRREAHRTSAVLRARR